MSKFKILGPSKLSGNIGVFGAKNAAMKMIAASVLINGKTILQNVPDILDIQMIIDILTENGANITRTGHTLEIDTTNLTNNDPNPNLVKKMRGSIVLIGPYLARFNKITIPHPGGCTIGSRPIDIHLAAFKKMGACVEEKDNKYYTLKVNELKNSDIHFDKISVTATENVLIAAVKTKGITKIFNAAREPEIVDLANFLNKCGAKIQGAGTSTITIEGKNDLNGTEYTVMPDRIETGTFIALAIATKSSIRIINCRPADILSFLCLIKEMGVKYSEGQDYIDIDQMENLKSINVETKEFPGFPTDLQAPMGLILTQTNGIGKITENIFENRLNYLHELEKMGAKIKIINNKEAIIYGPTLLRGKHIESLDLRSGATLILAGLCAEGETVISDIEIVDRGYEKIEERLSKLGARIERIN
jgi:UDP-N-acetylglucosamine 1-carboxyvinyltransferase